MLGGKGTPDTQQFDGYVLGPNIDCPFPGGQHIPGLNVGGWHDAGEFDVRTQSQYAVIQDLALAYKEFDLKWDQLTEEEKARAVEMHRPEDVPDLVQQVKHGILQVLAQIGAIGHPISGIIESTLRQYTHLGDGAWKTDGRIYSEKLGPYQVDGNFSGIPDDRWAFTTKTAGLRYGAVTSLSPAADGWDNGLAPERRQTAASLWDEKHAHPTTTQFQSFNRTSGAAVAEEWKAALVLEMLPSVLQRFGMGGWTTVRALPYMNAAYKGQIEVAVRAFVAQLDGELAGIRFGVPPRRGGWGGSAAVADLGVRMYFLHKAFPQVVGTDYTPRAVNDTLDTDPVSSRSNASYMGTSSKVQAYRNNRAENTFIPVGVIPGHTVVKPHFTECIDDFGFLWFESEYVIDDASKWIPAANAADSIVKEIR